MARRMNRLSIAGLFFGLFLLVALVVAQGFQELLGLLGEAGLVLLWLPVVWCPALLMTAEAWRPLFPVGQRPVFLHLLMASWVGRAVNTLLPVAHVGGEVAKARLITLWGGQASNAAAAVVVDKTVQVLAVLLWGVLGVSILFARQANDALAWALLLAFGVLALGAGGFFLVQKLGIFSLLVKLARLLEREGAWEQLSADAAKVDQIVMTIYRNRGPFCYALFVKTLSLVVQTGEVWLACRLLGHPIGLVEATMLKSLTATVTDLAFLVPNGYGVQEGAYIVIGALLGLGADVALAVSLAVRLRELVVDVPGLIYWQQLEGRILLGRKR